MQVIISVDGLSLGMLDVLLDLLPQSKSTLMRLVVHLTDGIFTTPQPIWSEFLTRSKWYENGCSSYARPLGSLNKLEIFSESDLLIPASLVGLKSAVINIPILKPNVKTRVWLSDGSLPINKIIAPDDLKTEQPFSSYVPRPFTSMVTTNGSLNDLAERCLVVEENRLQCALALLKRRKWTRFFYRISMFDQLTHIFGVNFMRCDDLSIFSKLKKFMAALDDALVEFSAACDEGFFVLSSYSHVVCRGSLNLNKVLESAGLFTSAGLGDLSQDQRIAAASAVYKFVPVNSQSSSMESQIGDQTIAASPTAGCIFINRQGIFENGFVRREEFETIRADIANFVRQILSNQYGQAFSMEENPVSRYDMALAPDFVVKIDGVEFNNVRDYAPVPRTTHSSEGFFLAPQQFGNASSLQFSEIGTLMSQALA